MMTNLKDFLPLVLLVHLNVFFFGLFNDDYGVAQKSESFAYIHNLGSTSKLDHVCHMLSITITKVVVNDPNFMSDHFPLSFLALIGDCAPSSNQLLKKQSVFYPNDRDRVFFWNACNEVLANVCIPFDLLMQEFKKEYV